MKIISTVVVATGLAAIAILIGLAGPARAIDDVNECPSTDASTFLDPWLLARSGDDGLRLADWDSDGFVCVARLVVHDRTLLTLATDNAIDNPGIIPPGPCTNPFLPLAIGNPGFIGNPNIREIDANGDGVLCGNVSLAVRGLIIVLLDNPNAGAR